MDGKPYIVGIGGANVDLCGRPRNAIQMQDSNPGRVRISAGGVTRNVCENLARLGADVRLITALGDDANADFLRRSCETAGIDLSAAYVLRDQPSSIYMSILDDAGDMLVAVSDMSALQKMPISHLWDNAALLRNAAFVLCDPGVPEAVLTAILDICEGFVPVLADPVSTTYTRKLAPHVGRLDTVKPNRLELEILSGHAASDGTGLQRACEAVLKKGTKRVLVSLGSEGCYYMDASGVCIQKKLRPVAQMANATGGGDAFFAAYVYARLLGLPLERQLDYALAAGHLTVSCEETVDPAISVPYLKTIIKENTL